MLNNGRNRVIIENVRPEIDAGRFPIKRVVGEKIVVTADIFTDGHDIVSARILFKKQGEQNWREVPLQLLENDCWRGEFAVETLGIYCYTITGWVDHFQTWRQDLKKKFDAGQDIKVDLLIGVELIAVAARRTTGEDASALLEFATSIRNEKDQAEAVAVALSRGLAAFMEKYSDRTLATIYNKELHVVVEPRKALFSAWYERFPRSCSPQPGKHGTFKDCEALLPEIARMGFDVLYLPPIHPIGKTNRKGKNNSSTTQPDDVGSPWAIGAKAGGHKAIHPELGTFEDFQRLLEKAKAHGLEIALDLAYQCTPDHPYVKAHPEWFKKRPDGSIQYAENPPKKYQDIFPINFESEDWQALWEELKSIVLFWIERGVRIFRVDNPHTKAFPFWEWMITSVKKDYPETIFLSEAFTRPKVMYNLAKVGFSQSYTYFTWRNTKIELTEYLTQLMEGETREFFRPNFWPNTPDILPEHLQYGDRPVFIIRLVLAATLSSNYGIYGPAFELCVSAALPGKEEYLNSEKFELKHWDWDAPGNLKDFIARMNKIRRENPALQATWNLKFYEVDNEHILFYGKADEDLANLILVAVNLDPYHVQSGWVKVPLDRLGIAADQPYLVHDLLSDDKYIWQGEKNYVQLDPKVAPAHIFRIRKHLKRETDFDYYF